MSNPVVSVDNSIPTPSDPTTVRKSYMMKVFDSLSFFLYPRGASASDFDPTEMGNEFYMAKMVGDAMKGVSGDLPPKFVTTGSWTGIQGAHSGFVTPNKSVMPKIMTPSTLMVDNGIDLERGSGSSFYWNGSAWKKLFNWKLDKFNGQAITKAEWYKYAQTGGNTGSQYVSVKAKDDKSGSNKIEMSLASPDAPPTGDWDSAKMVGGGAFILLLNIVGTTPAQAGPQGPQGVEGNRWKIVITFGDVTMTLADSSTMVVKIAGDDVETPVNLAEGAAKEGPPQQQHIADKAPILIGVYPCWNGIVVTSGSQETPQVTNSASTYCRKLKAATIQSEDYSTWFDPGSPDDVEVGVGAGAKDVLVDFGDSMSIVGENCRFEVAYLPRFFTKSAAFDGWLLLADDSAEISYDYNVYTIYTKNGTDFKFATNPTIVNSNTEGGIENTSYWYISWKYVSASSTYKRIAGEIFAYVLETLEERKYSIKNGNGAFALEWGGTGSNWKDYIKSVSVTVGIDGSSGSITVDKYGAAGQGAVAEQSIGAIVLDVTGGDNTVAGTIFKGLAMGISTSEVAGDATWTIPLIGLEKKLDDISLINPPYMDGETLSTAVDFLCRYAGIQYDLTNADSSVRLSATEEINAARFDWKSGTSVKTALEDVLQDVNHWYVVRDGAVFIYKLNDYGIPVSLGTDHSSGYSSVNIITDESTPDFEDLRNYVVAMALQKVSDGMGTNIENVPTFPMIEAIEKNTNPDVPWAKCWVRVFPGSLDPDTLSNIAQKMSNMSSTYELIGRTTIAGNASIKPYDKWGEYVISSVTHTIDLVAKVWTTDLDFIRATL